MKCNIIKKLSKYTFALTLLLLFFVFLLPKRFFKDGIFQETLLKKAPNAFIVSRNCSSARFHFTKKNIERAFPNFFKIHCFRVIPFTDSRIDKSLPLLDRKFASNLITFVTLWTHEIPKYSTNNELEWSFIFEDDVDFIDPSKFLLSNYLHPLEELMNNPVIQLKHGLFYLGICGPKFSTDNRPIIASFSNNSLLSRKGCGRCVHAIGLTTRRLKHLWFDISLDRPVPRGPTDIFIHKYCEKNDNYYILGSNVHSPLDSGHYGIAYQDRKTFFSEVSSNVI